MVRRYRADFSFEKVDTSKRHERPFDFGKRVPTCHVTNICLTADDAKRGRQNIGMNPGDVDAASSEVGEGSVMKLGPPATHSQGPDAHTEPANVHLPASKGERR